MVAQNKAKSNGHGEPEDLPPALKGEMSLSGLAGLAGKPESPNALNMLVDPGSDPEKDPFKVLMRVKFANRRQRIAAMHILAQCEEFGDDIAKAELYRNIVATVSEGGEGRHELVMAIVGDREFSVRQNNMGLGEKIIKAAGLDDKGGK